MSVEFGTHESNALLDKVREWREAREDWIIADGLRQQAFEKYQSLQGEANILRSKQEHLLGEVLALIGSGLPEPPDFLK